MAIGIVQSCLYVCTSREGLQQLWEKCNDAGLMFLTRLPCPKFTDHHPAFLMRSTQWFPIFGSLIGLWGAIIFMGATVFWDSAAPCVLLSTISTVWITGCFHEDGLADSFDAFGGGWGKSQILRILQDSRVGTYAVVGMILALMLKVKCLEMLCGGDDGMLRYARALISVHCASRWTSLPLIYSCTYVQSEEDAKRGLYNWFSDSKLLLTIPRLLFGTICAIIVPLLVMNEKQEAYLIFIAVILTTIASAYYGNAIIGGVIGDYLGATIQVAEIICYMALTANVDLDKLPRLATAIGAAALPILYSRKIVSFDC